MIESGSSLGRLNRYIKKTNSCWLWIGCKNKQGYGRFWLGRNEGAHRASWLLFVGRIPKNMQVLHRCDNPGCVNPEHLFLGTQKDNVQDMIKKRRGSIGEKHSRAKLSVADVLCIRKCGASPKYLAGLFGVDAATIHNILARRIWRHI
jgi:hypothetical protein